MRIGIIGGGFSGVAAAREAVKNGASVTLFSEENTLPYYRPRITSVAFSQAGEDEIIMHPASWYEENKIELLINTKVTTLDISKKVVETNSKGSFKFDKIIITTGAKPVIPPFSTALIQNKKISPLWRLEDAIALREKIPSIKSIAIIGGGLIGIEVALRAIMAKLQVYIIEKAPKLMARNLTCRASESLQSIFIEKGIKVITNSAIEAIEDKKDKIEIRTGSGVINADTAILCIGGIPNAELATSAGIEVARGIVVDEFMKTASLEFFASGDVSSVNSSRPLCSALVASAQGKIAGYNASREENFISYKQDLIGVEIKVNDFELHAIGDSEINEEKTECILEKEKGIYRSLIKEKEKILGIQMIGSGKDFVSYKNKLGSVTK